MIRFSAKYLLTLAGVILASCSKELPREALLPYYEKKCETQVTQGGFEFAALPLTADYEKAKWGIALDSGFRVLFWARPRTDASFREAFLIANGDTLRPVTYRKSPVFETGNTDAFVFAFVKRPENATLHIQDFGSGPGNVKFELKECANIRLREEE